jgi:predicted amidophosphoribosyltransferase
MTAHSNSGDTVIETHGLTRHFGSRKAVDGVTSCQSCSRKRVVTRERCEHCGEPFSGPPQDGTEIFEPMPGRHA